MIKMKCKCGAMFNAEMVDAKEIAQADKWVEAHKVCLTQANPFFQNPPHVWPDTYTGAPGDHHRGPIIATPDTFEPSMPVIKAELPPGPADTGIVLG
jgi:hypothetical protein